MSHAPHKPLVFSGMQPTNTLHLGNYLGALKNWVRLQDEMPCLYCVVDMHALTQSSRIPRRSLRATREVTAAYIASGVDPARSILFNQSQVPEHAELAWIFNCVARHGLARPHDAVQGKGGQAPRERAASDYLYLSNADGRRHSRLQGDACAGRRRPEAASRAGARHRAEIQQRFRRAGFFPAAGTRDHRAGNARHVACATARRRCRNPTICDYSRINLTDDADTIAQKIRKARTDPAPLPDFEKRFRRQARKRRT